MPFFTLIRKCRSDFSETQKYHTNPGIIAEEVKMLLDTLRPSQSTEPDTPSAGELTVRETECLHWVAAGKTSNEIAQITKLSEHTVNHYLSSCCRKLDAVNRIQAAVKAVRAGLI